MLNNRATILGRATGKIDKETETSKEAEEQQENQNTTNRLLQVDSSSILNDSTKLNIDDNLLCTPSELFTKAGFNKIFLELLNNDRKNFADTTRFLLSNILENIKEFSYDKSYYLGELIWYFVVDPSKKIIENVFLLASATNNNNTPPVPEYIEQAQQKTVYSFEKSNWIIQNFFNTCKTDNDVDMLIKLFSQKIEDNFFIYHVNKQPHPLANFKDLPDNILLKKDFSNAVETRSRIFYPKSFKILPTGSVIDGCCRAWDCGVLEYELIFKMGVNSETNSGSWDVVSNIYQAKNNSATSSSSSSSREQNEFTKTNNYRYFLTTDDYSIFTVAPKTETSKITGKTYSTNIIYAVDDDEIQYNLNSTINTFTANIEFPIPFIDLNYMIHVGNHAQCTATKLIKNTVNTPENSYLSSSSSSPISNILHNKEFLIGFSQVEDNSNSAEEKEYKLPPVVFCDKSRLGITALQIIPSTYLNNSAEGKTDKETAFIKLSNNMYTCQIIGRWK